MRTISNVTGGIFLALALAAPAAARADCDTLAPSLASFSFTPSSVNVSSADRTVACTMVLTDALSGVDFVSVSFGSPSGNQGQACLASAPASGTPNNGTYQCTVTIPKWSEAGTWTTAAISIRDEVGNVRVLATSDLIAAGFPTNLGVTANPDDTTLPVIGNVTLNPTTANTTNGPANVTCSVPVTDPAGTAPHTAQSGVGSVSCTLTSPSQRQSQTCTSTAPASGTRTNGTFSCQITLPRYSEAGVWAVSTVEATDAVGLDTTTTPAGKTVTVTSNPDTLAPSLVGFSFAPSTANTASGAVPVTCTMQFTDSPAGVQSATCSFQSPFDIFNPFPQTQTCVADTPASGTRQNGMFSCTAVLPRYSTGGVWKASVAATDAVGNSAGWDQFTLQMMGLPTDLGVDCGAGSSEAVIRFSNQTTLTWLPVAGALSYNVYRGLVSSLPNYGTCQNSRDPLLTDTVFVDTDRPANAASFTYLVSMKSATGEQGLGFTSFGTPRTASPPCP